MNNEKYSVHSNVPWVPCVFHHLHLVETTYSLESKDHNTINYNYEFWRIYYFIHISSVELRFFHIFLFL